MNAADRTDDELGRALGASLHDRHDSDPVPRPPFDGVEARAAATNRRHRVVVGLAAAALVVVAGIGVTLMATDDGESTTDVVDETRPDPTVPDDATPGQTEPDQTTPEDTIPEESLPADTTVPSGSGTWPELGGLVLADGTLITTVALRGDGTWSEEEGWRTDHPVAVVRVATDGSVVTEERLPGGATAVTVYRATEERTPVPGLTRLYDVADVGGVESLIGFGPTRPAETMPVQVVPLDATTAAVGTLGVATGPEFGVTHVDWSGDRGIVTAWSDLTETVEMRDLTGSPIEGVPSPTDDLAYNAPPLVTAAALSADRRLLLWAEGPDYGYDPDAPGGVVAPAPWRVRTYDLETDQLVLDVVVTDEVDSLDGVRVDSIHEVDGHLIVNRVDGTTPITPVIITGRGDDAAVVELPFTGLLVAAPRSS